jgi:N-acetyl-anhydromuramyl-L-alanine amidase AmpD
MKFAINKNLIPLEPGQAVSKGWTSATNNRPMGVTWHWTVTTDLPSCRRTIGGANAQRKGVASAHYAVGRSFAEGVDQYVSLTDRSWHAGINQTVRWDGQPSDQQTKGSRATIGVETVNIGYERPGVPAQPDWRPFGSVDGRRVMRVQPWTTEQITMMIAIGKTIVKRWKNIRVRDHHGHHDLCPGYKDDVAAFPFAEVLSGIYGRKVPDVWTLLALPMQRQNALFHLGFDLGTTGPAKNGVDGLWGSVSDRALRQFQEQNDLVPNAMWSTFVCWKIFDRLAEKKIKLADMAAEVERPAGGAPA